MNNLIKRAKELLENKTVQVVIGYEAGSDRGDPSCIYYRALQRRIGSFMMISVFRTLQFISQKLR